MPNSLIRIIALLVFPCLVVDLTLAHGISPTPSSFLNPNSQIFTQQALAEETTFADHEILRTPDPGSTRSRISATRRDWIKAATIQDGYKSFDSTLVKINELIPGLSLTKPEFASIIQGLSASGQNVAPAELYERTFTNQTLIKNLLNHANEWYFWLRLPEKSKVYRGLGAEKWEGQQWSKTPDQVAEIMLDLLLHGQRVNKFRYIATSPSVRVAWSQGFSPADGIFLVLNAKAFNDLSERGKAVVTHGGLILVEGDELALQEDIPPDLIEKIIVNEKLYRAWQKQLRRTIRDPGLRKTLMQKVTAFKLQPDQYHRPPGFRLWKSHAPNPNWHKDVYIDSFFDDAIGWDAYRNNGDKRAFARRSLIWNIQKLVGDGDQRFLAFMRENVRVRLAFKVDSLEQNDPQQVEAQLEEIMISLTELKRQPDMIVPASFLFWLILAITGNPARAARWGRRRIGGYNSEQGIGVLGGFVLAVVAPALWWAPMLFLIAHLALESLIALEFTRAPPEFGRQALSPGGIWKQFSKLESYGVPAFLVQYLNLPFESLLSLASFSILSLTWLVWAAHRHGSLDKPALGADFSKYAPLERPMIRLPKIRLPMTVILAVLLSLVSLRGPRQDSLQASKFSPHRFLSSQQIAEFVAKQNDRGKQMNAPHSLWAPKNNEPLIADLSGFQVVPDSNRHIETIVFNGVGFSVDVLEPFIKALRPDIRIVILTPFGELAPDPFQIWSRLKNIPNIEKRITFIQASAGTSWARDPFLVLFNLRTNQYTLLPPKLHGDTGTLQNRNLAQELMQYNIGLPGFSGNDLHDRTLELEGGDVTADDRYVYVGQETVEGSRYNSASEPILSHDQSLEAIHRVTGKEVIELPGPDIHNDRYQIPVGSTVLGRHTSIVGDILWALRLRGATPAALLRERMSKEEKALEATVATLKAHGIAVARVPMLPRQFDGNDFGIYYTNAVMDWYVDSRGHPEKQAIIPHYGNAQFDQSADKVFQKLGFTLTPIDGRFLGEGDGGPRCAVQVFATPFQRLGLLARHPEPTSMEQNKPRFNTRLGQIIRKIMPLELIGIAIGHLMYSHLTGAPTEPAAPPHIPLHQAPGRSQLLTLAA